MRQADDLAFRMFFAAALDSNPSTHLRRDLVHSTPDADVCTLALSHLAKTSLAVGSAAQAAEASKRLKCVGLGSGYTFYPVAIEGRTGAGVGAQGTAGSLDGGPEVVGVAPPAAWHRYAAGQCCSSPGNFASNG